MPSHSPSISSETSTTSTQEIPQNRSDFSWSEIRRLSDAGNLQQAVILLKSYPQPDSAFYFYNLGTLEYRLQHSPQAVAYLEKANRMRPNDSDIQNNLVLARSDLARAIGQDRLDPSSTWLEQLAESFLPEQVQETLSLLGILMILIWTWKFLRTGHLKKSILNTASAFFMFLFGFTGLFYLIQIKTQATPPAISLSNQAIRSGPGEHFMELGKLEAGPKLRVLNSHPQGNPSSSQQLTDVWLQIRYSKEGIGWVKASGLLLL